MNKLVDIFFRKVNTLKWELKFFIRPKKYNSKVFCIGFQKTGTTTIGKSLEILGYFHATFSEKLYRKYYLKDKIVDLLEYTAKFDSTDDLPWLKMDMIPVLDRVFPNSKFIYLTRDEESWKKSYESWYMKKNGQYPSRKSVKFKEFLDHRDFVMSYFKDKPSDQFLILDVRDEEAFDKLAIFLGKSAPYKRLPHFNETRKIS